MIDGDYDRFVKLPVFRESKIISTACLLRPIIERHLRTPNSEVKDLVGELGRALGINTRHGRIGLRSSIEGDLNRKPSNTELLSIAYRIAANKEWISTGGSASYSPQLVPLHWAIAEVCQVERLTRAKGRKSLHVTFKILTDRLAGRRYVHKSSWKWGRYLWGLGTAFPMKCRYLSPKQLMGFRYGLRLCWFDEDITCKEIAVSKSGRAKNVKLARSRVRNISPCPYKKAIDCIACNATRKECTLAVVNSK